MEISTLISLVTFIVAWVLGELSKKYKYISKKKIPIQNICVGVVIAIIEFIITKDFKLSIALSGLTAGGIYDVFSNLKELKEGK